MAITKTLGADHWHTSHGHLIMVHRAKRHGARIIENPYVSVHDTDGRFLINYPMDSDSEALTEVGYIAMAYEDGTTY